MYIYMARSIRGDGQVETELLSSCKAFIESKGHHTQFDLPVIERPLQWTYEEFVFERDLDWINHCDAMIAEVTFASTGVGFEVAYATYERHIPVFAVCLKDTRISAMISGGFKVFGYRDISDLTAYLETCMEGIHD